MNASIHNLDLTAIRQVNETKRRIHTHRVLARTGVIAITLSRALFFFALTSVAARFSRRERETNQFGEAVATAFEKLGGGFVKIGQLLSTRPELPDELTIPLRRLQDSLAPFPTQSVHGVIERSLGMSLENVFSSIDPTPIGSASIAQVHRATLRKTGADVAIKVRRPGIDETIRIDARVFTNLARFASWFPPFRRIPIQEATREVVATVEGQASFWLEANRHRQFSELFKSGNPVRVPQLVDEYCTDEILVMEYLPDLVRITDPALDEDVHRNAVIAGLRGLYRMLFLEGLVHCDLHPGNILVGREGMVVVVDFGFSARMRPSERAAFARLFLSIALGDGATAARIVRETALRSPANLDNASFEQEIMQLIKASAGQRASDFLISSFVTSLFKIQRKHNMYGSPSFTMAIFSLTVYEGVIRHRCADLDFQREAVPILLAAIQKKNETAPAPN
ncbi:MAG TPA: AarF/UbiB family protein [Pyrinomonadaceae bacterium]|nr:AarF/UbiB family protein [Pyrinomonadaceae bacterium]